MKNNKILAVIGIMILAIIAYVTINKSNQNDTVNNNSQKWSYFQFDNGDDYLVEGFRRIVLNGKIGYVDQNDNIIIKPQFKCAWPFENGKAKVAFECTEKADGEHTQWLSDSWFYIDTKGNNIK